jgi:hypothetical protein
MAKLKKTVTPSVPTKEVEKEVVAEVSKKISIDSLQKYLESCISKRDTFIFDDSKSAYEFGKKLRDIALKEEGVDFAEQMKKFDVEINYNTVRLRFLGD